MSTANYAVQTRICRSPAEVFDAIVQPQQLQEYFVDRAEGEWHEGQAVVWHWEQWGDYPVQVIALDRPRRIELEIDSTAWKKTTDAGYPVRIVMELTELDDGGTMLQIRESGWQVDTSGLKASHENCSGWTHMAMCLKAYLEHGLDMR